MMGQGPVVKPEGAGGVFAAPNQAEIAFGKQFRCRFGQWAEHLFGGALLPGSHQIRGSILAGEELQVAFRLLQELVQSFEIDPFSGFSFFD